jgi:hypothetical protein
VEAVSESLRKCALRFFEASQIYQEPAEAGDENIAADDLEFDFTSQQRTVYERLGMLRAWSCARGAVGCLAMASQVFACD